MWMELLGLLWNWEGCWWLEVERAFFSWPLLSDLILAIFDGLFAIELDKLYCYSLADDFNATIFAIGKFI